MEQQTQKILIWSGRARRTVGHVWRAPPLRDEDKGEERVARPERVKRTVTKTGENVQRESSFPERRE